MIFRKSVTSTIMVCAALGAAGCTPNSEDGGADGFATSPVTNTTTSATASASPTSTFTPEQEAVVAAYTKFATECMVNVEKDPVNAKKHIAPCTTKLAAEEMGAAQANAFILDGRRFEGREKAEYTIHSVQLDVPKPGLASVKACADYSEWKAVSVENGDILGTGFAKDSEEAVLEKVDGVWKVDKIVLPKNDQEAYCR